MQPFELFSLELQVSRRKLRQRFQLPDEFRFHLEDNGVVQSWGDRLTSLPGPGRRSSRRKTKSVFAGMAAIGIAAIGILYYASNEGKESKQRGGMTQGAAMVQENDKPVVFGAILTGQASCSGM